MDSEQIESLLSGEFRVWPELRTSLSGQQYWEIQLTKIHTLSDEQKCVMLLAEVRRLRGLEVEAHLYLTRFDPTTRRYHSYPHIQVPV